MILLFVNKSDAILKDDTLELYEKFEPKLIIPKLEQFLNRQF